MKSVDGISIQLLMLVIALAIKGIIYPGLVWGQDSLNVSLQGQLYDFWSTTHDVAISGDYAYVADGMMGLRVVDISELESPVEVGRLLLNTMAEQIEVKDSYAYIMTYDSTLKVVDISEAANPQLATELYLGGRGDDMLLEGDYIYLALHYFGLMQIDISVPANPQAYLVENCIGYYQHVDVEDDLLYFADEIELMIFGLTEPGEPQLISSQQLLITIGDFEVRGEYLFAGGDFFSVLNVADPHNVFFVSQCWTTTYPYYGVTVCGDYAYIGGFNWCSTWLDGISVVDISDPEFPAEVFFEGGYNGFYEACAIGDYLFTAIPYGGLVIFDISQPGDLIEMSQCYERGYLGDMEVKENLAIVRDYFNGFRIVDISDESNPVELSVCQLDDYVHEMCVGGDLVYCTFNDSVLLVTDISNPAEPQVIGEVIEENYFLSIGACQNYLYTGVYYSGFNIYDVSDPSNPVWAGQFGDFSPEIVEISGSTAFVVDNSEILILDLTDPVNPVLLSTMYVNYPTGIAVEGNTMCIVQRVSSQDADVLMVADISDPANPVITGNIQTADYTSGVDCRWGYAYVSGGSEGIFVYDYRNPAQIELTGFYNTPGYASDVKVIGESILVSDKNFFGIYDCSAAVRVGDQSGSIVPGGFSLSPIYPNPFNATATIPFTLERAGRVELTIFDITGRSVGVQYIEPLQAGMHEIEWDAGGCASGVYLVRLTVDGKQQSVGTQLHETRKAVLVK